jgi:hypothetical protein
LSAVIHTPTLPPCAEITSPQPRSDAAQRLGSTRRYSQRPCWAVAIKRWAKKGRPAMSHKSENQELVRVTIVALVIIGCPVVGLGSLYLAAYCAWQSAADPSRSSWGWWFYGFLTVGILAMMLPLWLVIRNILAYAKKKKLVGERLALIVRNAKSIQNGCESEST